MKDEKPPAKNPARTERAARKKKRLRPVSLYPLDFDTAIAGFVRAGSSPKSKK